MRIRWTPEAAGDLEQICSWIEERSPKAALGVAREIRTRIQELRKHPRLGRPGQVEGTRELVLTGLPYLAIYDVQNDAIRVLRVPARSASLAAVVAVIHTHPIHL